MFKGFDLWVSLEKFHYGSISSPKIPISFLFRCIGIAFFRIGYLSTGSTDKHGLYLKHHGLQPDTLSLIKFRKKLRQQFQIRKISPRENPPKSTVAYLCDILCSNVQTLHQEDSDQAVSSLTAKFLCKEHKGKGAGKLKEYYDKV
jgi:hypothetical protein